MNVLVTGATGFLGTWVTRALVAAGHSVRIVARRPERLGALAELPLDVVRGDVLDPVALDRAAHGMEAIVHSAGMVSWRPRDGDRVRRVNVDGTSNVAEVARARRLRLVHTSSIATSGATRAPRLLDEESAGRPPGFPCAYTESKRASERIVLQHAAAHGVDVVVLSPGVVLGPGDRDFGSTQVVLRYLRGELHHHLDGGTSYCDARDVAAAFVRALTDGRSGERYLLAGINRSHRELRDDLRRLTGLQRSFPLARGVAEWAAAWSELAARCAPHPFEDVNLAVIRWGASFAYCSAAKAERELGYRRRPFDDTLRDTIADHLRRGAAPARTAALRAILRDVPPPDGSTS